MAVIYRITNKVSKKVYIGETKEKNPFVRWNQHINNTLRNKGCPALRDAIKKYGIENFKFEIILFCFDEDRFQYEILYIKNYNSVVPNGYNICKGGYGGGFINKKHTPETIMKIKQTLKETYKDGVLSKKISERNKICMNTDQVKKKIKEGQLKSEKWKKAIEEKRVGGQGNLQTKESKKKISESLKKYWSENPEKLKINITKHRESMSKAVGIPVKQYSLDGILLNTYQSMSEASRQSGISKSMIGCCISGKSKAGKGFIWTK